MTALQRTLWYVFIAVCASLAEVGADAAGGTLWGESDASSAISANSAVAASAGNDWYRPQPPSLPSEGTPLILPVTTERPIMAVPAVAQKLAISKLAKVEIVQLTRDDFGELKIQSDPNELLEELIKKKARQTKDGVQQIYRPGAGWSTLHYNFAIPGSREEAAHWNSLKGQLRPYLVRAVEADGTDNQFFASLWRDALTITHHSVMETLKGDPFRQHAAIVVSPTEVCLTKSPVVVYLEAKPAAVYTEIEIVRLGR